MCQNNDRRSASRSPARRTTHQHKPTPTSSIGTFHHPRGCYWMSGVAEPETTERPPEHPRVGPRPGEHQMEQCADRQPQQHPANRLATAGRQHQHCQQHHAERQAVQHPRPAERRIGQCRQHCTDEQQAIVERGVAEHEPHGHHRRADEPEEHRLQHEEPTALRAVGDPARGCGLVFEIIDLVRRQIEVAPLAT